MIITYLIYFFLSRIELYFNTAQEKYKGLRKKALVTIPKSPNGLAVVTGHFLLAGFTGNRLVEEFSFAIVKAVELALIIDLNHFGMRDLRFKCSQLFCLT